MSLISKQNLESHLSKLKNWSFSAETNSISKLFEFRDFAEAFGFMTQAAIVSEKMNHHPEWKNIYNRVWVELTTHDFKGVTLKDIELARSMDLMYRP